MKSLVFIVSLVFAAVFSGGLQQANAQSTRVYEVTGDFDVNGSGTNVDSQAFYEAPNPVDSLMFVSSKNAPLVEVWKYPFDSASQQTALRDTSCITAGTNGVLVDQETDLLYVAVSNSPNICVFQLPNRTFVRKFTSGVNYGIEPNLAMVKLTDGSKRLYVSNERALYVHNPTTGALITSKTQMLPSTKTLEAMIHDNYYQALYIPDENFKGGIFAFKPDLTSFVRNNTNVFGTTGIFNSDEEGILMYTCPADGKTDNGRGYIFVSDQIESSTSGNDYEIFDRVTWAHLGKLKIRTPSGGYVYNTDGIASTQQSSPRFPGGVFVALQNDASVVGVSWNKILTATGLTCTGGAGPTVAQPTPTRPAATTTPAPTVTRIPTAPINPTATPVAGGTQIRFNVKLHGLGNGGDNVNPAAVGNFNLRRQQRAITVELYNAQNLLVTTRIGTVTFNQASGVFSGTIELGTGIQTGVYTVKVSIESYLKTFIPGIQTITAGRLNQLSEVVLITGDLTADNVINIMDYNFLMGCYADLRPATNCPGTNSSKADINDDGVVNQLDYNLLLREMSTRAGVPGAGGPVITPTPIGPTPTNRPAASPTPTNRPGTPTPTVRPGTPTPTTRPSTGTPVTGALYVSPSGNDANPGTQAAPFRTVAKGMSAVAPGQTLYLRAGTYAGITGTLKPGTTSSRITMRSYPGEKAIISGHSVLSNPQFWTVADLEFTWPGSPRISGGDGAILYVSRGNDWVLENLDVHHGSYAGILVGGPSSGSPAAFNGVIRNVAIHDTGAVGLYFNPGTSSRNMLIERSLFWNNGTENVKLGWGGGSCSYGVGEVTFRYNTLHAAVSHFNLIIADPANTGTGKIDVYRNIFNKAPRASVQYDNAAGCLGNRTYMHDNAWSETPKFSHDRDGSATYTETNNVQIAPQFNSISVGGFRPNNPQAAAFGKYAP